MSNTIWRSLAAAAALAACAGAFAMEPPEGTLDENNTTVSATGGPYTAANQTGLAGDPICANYGSGPGADCDQFFINNGFSAGFVSANPNAQIRITVGWDLPADDIDVYAYDDATGELIGQAASADNPETILIALGNAPARIRVDLVLFATTGSTATLTADLVLPTAEAPIDPCAETGAAEQSTRIDPEVLADWDRLSPSDRYGAFVHFAWKSKANDALLEALGFTLVADFRRYARSVFVEGPVSAFRALADSPAVAYIEYNRPLRYFGDTQSWATRVRVAQEQVSGGPYRDANGQIIDGTGVTLGIIDSGLYGAHPDFSENLMHNYKLVNISGIGPAYVDIGPADSESQVGGHGTHVTGTVAGRGNASTGDYPVDEAAPYIRGTYTGAAPGAKIIHWGNGAGIFVLSAVSAYRHVLDNLDSWDPPLVAINNSYGSDPGPYNPAATSSCLIKDIVEAGVVMAFAAGNDGGDGTETATSPTCKDPTPGVICVASYNDQGTGHRNAPLSGFSSRGKRDDPTDYPDISAPGDLITSTCFQSQPSQAICTGGDNEVAADQDWFPWYGTISGTSMATPHITGIVGLIQQAALARDGRFLTPAEVEDLILDNARKVGDLSEYVDDPQNPGQTTHFGYGAGLVDLPSILDAMGIAKDGLPVAGEPFVIFDGDADANGADDVVKLTMADANVDGVTGVEFRLTLADASDLGSADRLYRIEYNAAGIHKETAIVSTADGLSVPEAGDGNTAVATQVVLDGNDIVAFVPLLNMDGPGLNEPIHNIRVFVETATGIVDIAPSPLGSTNEKQPQFGRAFTVQQVAGLPPPSDERSCVLPGLTMVTAPAGTTGNASGTGHDDGRQVWIAEPTDMPGKIVFTLKVDNLAPAPIAGYRWYVYFNIEGDPTNHWVAMDTTGGVPAFTYGTREVLQGPVGVGVYDTLGNLDAESNYTTDGVITLVMDKSVLPIETGMVLRNIAFSIRQTSNPANGAGLTVDTAAGGTPYTVVGNDVCAALEGPNVVTGPGAAGAGPVRARFGALGAPLLALFGAAALLALRRRHRH